MINQEPPGIAGQNFVRENQPKQDPQESFLTMIGKNITKISDEALMAGVPPGTDITSKSTRPVLEFIMLGAAKQIYERSNTPVSIFDANTRNTRLVTRGEKPIQDGDYLHGMAIDYFKNAGNGILAPELYGGETRGPVACSLYVSHIINVQGATPMEIIEHTQTRSYGLQQGKVTVVFDKDAPLRNLNRNATIGTGSLGSVAQTIAVGEPLTSIKCCVISNSEDISRMKTILLSLKIYVPLYDSAGNLLFTKNDWLDSQNKS